MNSPAILLAPLALLLSAPLLDQPAAVPRAGQEAAESPQGALPPMGFQRPVAEPLRVLENARHRPDPEQVRIEQRVIIRILPGPPSVREEQLADLPRRPLPQRYQEEELKGCVPVNAIVATQPASEDRLLLFMRDRRILSAALERACNAHDFYSGFYIDQPQICGGRAKIQSRTGSRCKVEHLNRLVAVSD
ncbi:conserved hypothetical protein [Altererythrobacter sp. B11]|uniref:hypothetical protein n=1 Tax=Altererythrobacter sp. B11 TaxID=2060312 RepID=UPI000DC731DD|nr:hypothetical protein [Altererythrobacter sp. B11]BBC72624.1 conserved hypothetical protein [Altererythrobacter sp. B11]